MSFNDLWMILRTQFSDFGSHGIALLLLNVIMAILMSLLVFIAYRLTYTGTAFSKKFMISLGMMTLVTTVIMNVISNNVALSLGMVGALSIIRFRTAVKDVRDATYIFWCIGIGICCGVSMYAQALFGSAAILLFLLVMGQVRDEGKYLLIVKCNKEAQNHVQTAILKYYAKSAHLRVQNASGETGDLIYEVSSRAVKRAAAVHGTTIMDLLLNVEGVLSIDLVQQTEDISR
ncbi:MAG: DUF4956 domain-containing protein [Clostridia bacterium]